MGAERRCSLHKRPAPTEEYQLKASLGQANHKGWPCAGGMEIQKSGAAMGRCGGHLCLDLRDCSSEDGQHIV